MMNKMATSDNWTKLSNDNLHENNTKSDNAGQTAQQNGNTTSLNPDFTNFQTFTSSNQQIHYRNAREYAQALNMWLCQYRMVSAFSVFHSHMISAMSLPQNNANNLGNVSRPPNTSRTNTVNENNNDHAANGFQGTHYKVPLLWRRVAAEVLDFILLFYAKILVTLAILRQLGYMNDDFVELEAQLPFISDITELDYDKMFALTSELIALEVLNRLCITLVETLCLRKGYAGSIGGATPGKKIMHLRVVSFDEVRDLSDGNILVMGARNPGLMNALVRSVIKNFSMAFFFPACLTYFFFRFNRCAYDILAHTIVVEIDHGNQQQQQQ